MWFNINMRCLLIITILITGFSCSRSNKSAEEVLKKFIDHRLARNYSKGELIKLTTGEFRELIDGMNDEQFAEYKASVNYRKFKYKSIFRNCSEQICSITYDLVLTSKEKDKKHTLEVRKVAVLVNSPDGWKLKDISNVKTYFDLKKDLAL